MNPIRILRAATLALIAGAALTACTMGPNFEAPASTVPPVFARTQTLQAPSQPVDAAFDADWWTLFDDPVLNTLEQRLADANLDVAAASANLLLDRISAMPSDHVEGFDPDAVPEDRMGVRNSIVDRMARHGGTAEVRTQPGEGTEVRLRLQRPDPATNHDQHHHTKENP